MKSKLSIILLIAIIICNILMIASCSKTKPSDSAVQAIRDSLTLTFHDEFNGNEIDKTKWGYEYDLNGGNRNGECQLYTSNDNTKNAYVEDGNLIIEGRRVTKDEVWYNADGTKQEPQQDEYGNYYLIGNDGKSKYYYTSASLRNYWARYPNEDTDDWSVDHWTKVYQNNGFKFGMLEARIMFPEQSKESDETWCGFWTTGQSAIGPQGELDSNDKTKNWPNAGEIDIAELFPSHYDMNQVVHYSLNDSPTMGLYGGYNPGYGDNTTAIRGTYHTYGVFYTDKLFMYYVDDCIISIYDITSPEFDFFRKNPQFVFINMAIGDSNAYEKGVNATNNFVKAQMKVDYIRAYQAKDGDYSHINVINLKSGASCNADYINGSYAPDGNNTAIMTSDTSFDLVTNDKFSNGNYDVYLTGTKANGYTGAFNESIDGSSYTATADYTDSSTDYAGNSYFDDLSTYIGTVKIADDAHNLKINVKSLNSDDNAGGSLLRSLVLVGKSKATPTATVNVDSKAVVRTPPSVPSGYYDACDATLGVGASIANNHTGYWGKGFVENFGSLYSSVTFDIDVEKAGDYLLKFRYANACGDGNDAHPTLYIDDVKIKELNFAENGKSALPLFAGWNYWNENSEYTAKLQAGRHSVKIVNDNESYSANIDGLTVERVEGSIE